MKQFSILLFALLIIPSIAFSQGAEDYNLESQNLHKKVRKTRTNYYMYDNDSGGFILRSTSIDRYNDDGNLEETFYQYYGSYSKTDPVKKLYNYNSKNQLISTKDISNTRGTYSTNLNFTYDNDGNLVKRESVYKDNSKYLYTYAYDRRDRRTSAKEYNKDDKLTSEISISHDGRKRTETKTGFNSKDGSIYGTYTTVYENDIKKSYKVESKYSNYTTTYTYDNEDNLIKSISDGKNSYLTTYDYVYDKKDNWTKKHYRSGKYQYFYFREVMLENGDVTGSDNFDTNFVRLHGNFANTNVVPVVMKKSTTNKNNTNTNNTNTTTNSSTFSSKNWTFNYTYSKDAIKKLSGTVAMKTDDNMNLKVGSNTNFYVKFNGQEFNLKLNVTNFTMLEDKYEYSLKSSDGGKATLWVYKKETELYDDSSKTKEKFKVNSILKIEPIDASMFALYLK